MKQYMLSVHHDSKDAFRGSRRSRPRTSSACHSGAAFNQDLTSSGAWVFGGGLTLPDTATTMRETRTASCC